MKKENLINHLAVRWLIMSNGIRGLQMVGRLGGLKIIVSISSGKTAMNKRSKSDKFKYPVYGAGGVIAFSDEYFINKKVILNVRIGTHGLVQRINEPFWLSDNTLIFETGYYEFLYHTILNLNYDELNRGGVRALITQKDIKITIL